MANTIIVENMHQVQHHLDARLATMDFNFVLIPLISHKYHFNTLHQYHNLLYKNPSPKWLTAVDVFIDDIIALAPVHPRQLPHVHLALFHSTNIVFRPLKDCHNPHQKETISVKQLDTGD